MTIPKDFTQVDPHSQTMLRKGDQICFISEKPWWLPGWFSNVVYLILPYCPGVNQLKVAYNGSYHYLKLEKAYTDGHYVYMIYRMTSNAILIIVVAVAAGLLISFINGYLAAVAVRKQAGAIGQGIFTLGLLALVVAVGVYVWRRWIAPGGKK